MFNLRFDMRAPETGAPISELYRTAIEMTAWAETRGGTQVILSEHHGTSDGHLPSPLILASAMAARTERIGIMLAAVVLPFRDPVLLAEEMCVLDIISNGRVSYVFGIGHRAEEYEHFNTDFSHRGRLADEKLAMLIPLLQGTHMSIQHRKIEVTPASLAPAGPRIMIAGGSVAAAKRAGRFGLGLIAQANAPGMTEAYHAACEAYRQDPKFVQLPDPNSPTTIFVTDNVDAAWAEIGPYLLHDALAAAEFRHGEEHVASISTARSIDDLRAEDRAYRIMTVEDAAERIASGKRLGLLPICGGMPPEIAWRYLRHAAASADLTQRRQATTSF